jgi:CRP-like cAMP-binding protein
VTLTRIIRRCEAASPLSHDEKSAIGSRLAVIGADEAIVREGDRPTHSCLLLAGTACSYKVVVEGKRQIVSFHIAGDAPDLQSLNLAVLDFGISAIAPCNVAFVPHQAIRDLCARYPRVANAFWRITLVEAAIFREWMTGIGRRPAVSRMAHLFCELFVRSSMVGLVHDRTINFPVTQNEIGDAIGLSTVHTNRSLQELRAAKLIEFKKGSLQFLDWEGL